MVSVTAHFCQFSPEAETNLEFYQQRASQQNEAFSRMLLLKLIVHSNIGPPSLLGWKTQHCQLLTCDKSSD